jgi:hypothetical protein
MNAYKSNKWKSLSVIESTSGKLESMKTVMDQDLNLVSMCNSQIFYMDLWSQLSCLWRVSTNTSAALVTVVGALFFKIATAMGLFSDD